LVASVVLKVKACMVSNSNCLLVTTPTGHGNLAEPEDFRALATLFGCKQLNPVLSLGQKETYELGMTGRGDREMKIKKEVPGDHHGAHPTKSKAFYSQVTSSRSDSRR
jgi:hypothetical protein